MPTASLTNPEKIWMYVDNFIGNTTGAYGHILGPNNTEKTISSLMNNGSGLIRIVTSTAHGYSTGKYINVSNTGVGGADGSYLITVVSTTVFDLQSSTYTAPGSAGRTIELNNNSVASSTLINFCVSQGVTGVVCYDMPSTCITTGLNSSSTTWSTSGKNKFADFVLRCRAAGIDVGVPMFGSQNDLDKLIDYNNTRTNSSEKIKAFFSENEWWATTTQREFRNLLTAVSAKKAILTTQGIDCYCYIGNSKSTGYTYSGDSSRTVAASAAGITNNGSGKVRVTFTAAHYWVTGDIVTFTGVSGLTNGAYTVTYVSSTILDLTTVTFTSTGGGGTATWPLVADEMSYLSTSQFDVLCPHIYQSIPNYSRASARVRQMTAAKKVYWILSYESAHVNKAGGYYACATPPDDGNYSNFSGNFAEGRAPMASSCPPNPTPIPANNAVTLPPKSFRDGYNYVTHTLTSPTPAQTGSPISYDADTNTNAVNYAQVSGLVCFSWQMIFIRNMKNGTISCSNSGNQSITFPTNTVSVSATVVDDNLPSVNAGTRPGSSADATYTYAWTKTSGPTGDTIITPSSLSTNITFTTAGTYVYKITVTDGGGATSNSSLTITVVSATSPMTLTMNETKVATCRNSCDGEANVGVSGGSGVYTYLWNTGATTAAVTGLCGGVSYTVTVTDTGTGEVKQGTVTITNPTAVTVSIGSVTNVACFGGSTGSATATPTGANGGPWTYSWTRSGGGYTSTSATATSMPIGTYTVVATGAGGCTGSATVTITQPTQLVATSVITNETCYGANNGAVDISVTGGTAPYTYSWVRAKTKSITALADNGAGLIRCTCATHGYSTGDVIVVSGSANTAANGTWAIISITSGSFDLANSTWSGSTATATSNAYTATTQDITGLKPDTYTVTVTDANSCITSLACVVGAGVLLSPYVSATYFNIPAIANDPTGITASGTLVKITTTAAHDLLTGDTVTVTGTTIAHLHGFWTITVINATSFTLNGSIFTTTGGYGTIIPNRITDYCIGGLTSLSYLSIDDAFISLSSATFLWSTGETTNIKPMNITASGTYSYTCTVTLGGCSRTVNFRLIVGAPSSYGYSIIQETPLTGCVGVTSKYRVGIYHTIESTINGGITVSVGKYKIKTTAAHMLVTGDSVVITGASPAGANGTWIVTVTSTTEFTLNGSVGSAGGGGTVLGGLGPYSSIVWADSFGDPAGTGPLSNALDLDLSTAGGNPITAQCFVSGGCPEVLSYTAAGVSIVISVVQINPPSICSTALGGVDVSVAGGCSPYTYLWSNGVTTQDLTGAQPGIYTLVVTDAARNTGTGTFTIPEPNPILITASVTQASTLTSQDGALAITITGGTPLSGGNYTIHVYDINGVEKSDTVAAAGIELIDELLPGSYSIVVADVNECTASTIVEIGARTSSPEYPLGWDDEEFTCFLRSANCCAANMAWSYLSKKQRGVQDCDCEKEKAWTILNLIDILKCWYPPQQVVAPPRKSLSVIRIAKVVPSFSVNIGMYLSATATTLTNVSANLILGDSATAKIAQIVSELNGTTATTGLTAEYVAYSTEYLIYIYGPTTEGFNGTQLTYTLSNATNLTSNGFVFGSEGCGAAESNSGSAVTITSSTGACLTMAEVEKAIEFIKIECGCCNCHSITDLVQDDISI